MQPFEGDLFQRKEQAERLLKVFSLSQTGLVVTIDAPWGDGKSYFAVHFKKMMDSLDCKSVLIDAFQHDHIDDPLILLSGAIYKGINNKPVNKRRLRSLKEKAIRVGTNLIPTAAKIAITVGGAGIIDGESQKAVFKDITKIMADTTADIIKDQIANYEKAIKGVDSFKQTLNEIASQCRKDTENEPYPMGLPLIVIIDELDRCSPIFAVKMLERIKHFFSVDNVVFVLMVNKEQLIEYIKGMYGAGVNGEAYLEKFIDLSINLSSLPPNQRKSNCYVYAMRCKAKQLFIDPNEPLDQKLHTFLTAICSYKYIPLRCIDKYYLYTQFVRKNTIPELSWYMGVLILLKIMKPSLYDRFMGREKEATASVEAFFVEEMPIHNEVRYILLMMIRGYHQMLDRAPTDNIVSASPRPSEVDKCAQIVDKWCEDMSGGTKDAFHHVSQLVDFKS